MNDFTRPIESPREQEEQERPVHPKDIQGWIQEISTILRDLPAVELDLADRMHLSGFCFQEGPKLVAAVADALSETGGLFPQSEVLEDPQSLVARSERATAFYYLSRYLLKMSQWAHDAYLVDRSATVEAAMAVVKSVRSEGALKHRPPAHRLRRRALCFAEHILKEKLNKSKAQANRRKKANSQVTEKPQSRRGIPQREAAAKAQKAERKEHLDHLFFPEKSRRKTPPLQQGNEENRRSNTRSDHESD